MYQLLHGEIENPQTLHDIDFTYIHKTYAENEEYHFLHGVSIDRYQGKWYATFAYNNGDENTVTEVIRGKTSMNGHGWKDAFCLPATPQKYANSHSVFAQHNGELWLLGPHFMGLGPTPHTLKGYPSIWFQQLFLEGWKYNTTKDSWTSVGRIGDDFWPLQPPEKMENGSYIMAGIDEYWRACVAVSDGDDFTRWRVHKLELQEEVFTEPGIWVRGHKVCMVMRNESYRSDDGFYHAMVAVSDDDGESFSEVMESNLPMNTTKPFCGRLNDGRPYLIFNYSPKSAQDRSRLLLGIGEKNSFAIRRVYVVDEWDGGLSYPYAGQFDDRLIVVYSAKSPGAPRGNYNDAKMAQIPIEVLDL